MDLGTVMSGYTVCGCRDCFDIAITSTPLYSALCQDCRSAGCEADDGECQQETAYGVGDEET